MAKPIFLIRIPKALNMPRTRIEDISAQLGNKFNDEYHIVAFICQFAKEVTFECHNTENQDEMEIENLKKYIKLMMNTNPALL